MKLKEYLATLDGEAYVYIGCKDNCSGFFFIGTVDEFNSTKESNKRKSWLKASILQKEMKIKFLENSIRMCNHKVSTSTDRAERRKYRAYIRNHNRNIELFKGHIQMYTEELENFVNYGNRQVIDEYARKWVEPLGRIVIVEGRAGTGYWTLEEVENG